MNAPPDFDQLALDLLMVLHSPPASSDGPVIREKLRQVWNARGAADITAVDAKFGEMWATVGPMIPGTTPHPIANVSTVSRMVRGVLRKLDSR